MQDDGVLPTYTGRGYSSRCAARAAYRLRTRRRESSRNLRTGRSQYAWEKVVETSDRAPPPIGNDAIFIDLISK